MKAMAILFTMMIIIPMSNIHGRTYATLSDTYYLNQEEYHFIALVYNDSTDVWKVCSNYNYDHGAGCSWSVELDLPQDGDVIGLNTICHSSWAPYIFLSYSDGKTYYSQGFVFIESADTLLLACEEPSEWYLINDFHFDGTILTTIGEDGFNDYKQQIQLNNYPNPFNPTTTINYTVLQEAPVEIKIFNVKGELIRTLVSDNKQPGNYSAVWDGKNNRGSILPSGVYFYILRTGNATSSKKMVIIK